MTKPTQDWDAGLYASKHGYVHSLVADLVDEIDDWTGLRVVDVGCGTGELTDELRRRGAEVVGVDSSLPMIRAAQERFTGLDLQTGDARNLSWEGELDVVFSNAALHWVPEADQVAASFARALKSGGRLLLEMGGSGNVAAIRDALTETLTERGHRANAATMPWYFPTVGQYAAHLEDAGFVVKRGALFERPTTLEGEEGMANWLQMFARAFFEGLDAAEVQAVTSAVANKLRASLYRNGQWHADYVRLRMYAEKR
jgi:trans-aconitate methyltransferase